VPFENHQATRKNEHNLHEKSQDENVIILEGIIDDLRRLGDSDVVLDKEERALVQDIWGSVASSTHFFVSAIAYEQRQYIKQHNLFDRMHIICLFFFLNLF
jgi:alkylhydroperoxidase family enzyme